MEKSLTTPDGSLFESIRQVDDNGVQEFWWGRDLAKALGYDWRGFNGVVEKAMLAIANTGQNVENHFVFKYKMVLVGSGSQRQISDIKLTRFACYIIAQNGNAARLAAVAEAQAYFAHQTRRQELADMYQEDMERVLARHKFTSSDKLITMAMFEKGLAPRGVAHVKNSGDQKLFGGKTTRQVKEGYGITDNKTPWADRAPNVVLAAKSLANEMTAQNLTDQSIFGFDDVKQENDDNNTEVRQTLLRRGLRPETLPPSEDTKQVAKRLQQTQKELGGSETAS